MPSVSALVCVILASVALPSAALAQAPSQSDPKDHERPRPPNVENRVELHLRYHYSQPDPFLEQSHGQFPFGNRMNRFGYDGVFTFDPPSEVTTPLPLELSLTGNSRTTTVTTDFGRVTQILAGNARNDPVVTKPGLFGGAGDDEEDDSDTTPLVGPQLAYPLAADMSEWGPTSWLPENTMLLVYGKALFGSFEVFDEDASIQLYSVGLEVRFPIYGSDAFRVGAALAAGPAYLHTGIGDAFGFEAAAGLRFAVPLSGGLSFLTNVDVSLYASENVTSWGPGLSFGLTLSW